MNTVQRLQTSECKQSEIASEISIRSLWYLDAFCNSNFDDVFSLGPLVIICDYPCYQHAKLYIQPTCPKFTNAGIRTAIVATGTTQTCCSTSFPEIQTGNIMGSIRNLPIFMLILTSSKLFVHSRCRKWVRNCANDELTNVWNESPDKVPALRICQKHFLKEFLGSSTRLVGHAVPTPHGIVMDEIGIEKFMVDCASSKSSLHPVRQSVDILQTYQHQSDQEFSYPTNHDYSYQQMNSYNNQQSLDTNLVMDVEQTNIDLQSGNCQFPPDPYVSSNPDAIPTVNEIPSECNNYNSNYPQVPQHSPVVPEGDDILVYQQNEIATSLPVSGSDENHVLCSPNTNSLLLPGNHNHQENPRINYDREGNVIGIQYSTETVSLIGVANNEQNQAHITALKHKIRYYQRKLAVKTHRYQKLKSQTKGRSNKTRLLESLKTCKADFSPCVFEIFKRQIKGPLSKHGNRWSDDVKSFSSAVYLRSKSAYKFIRKSIDLPSESIVKRYITENNLSRVSPDEQEDED